MSVTRVDNGDYAVGCSLCWHRPPSASEIEELYEALRETETSWPDLEMRDAVKQHLGQHISAVGSAT
jgi:hypothetical protein